MIKDNKRITIKIRGKIYHCAMDITMDFIGGKWKTVVLWYLRKEKKRFCELKELIPDITDKMLSTQLKQLEQDGIVRRKLFLEVPLRTEYQLTTRGKTLIPILEEIAKWGRDRIKSEGKVTQRPLCRIKKQ